MYWLSKNMSSTLKKHLKKGSDFFLIVWLRSFSSWSLSDVFWVNPHVPLTPDTLILSDTSFVIH